MFGSVFRFWCFVRFAGFLQFSLWFSVFVNNNSFYGFSGFAKEVTPVSHAKTVILRPTQKRMHDKPSLFSSRYLGRN